MDKTLGFIITAAILLFACRNCEGLECYRCYTSSGAAVAAEGEQALPACNEKDLAASNTVTVNVEKSKCIYATVEIPYTKQRQIWRTNSKEGYQPCDPNAFPAGIKMIDCIHCETDKCNLYGKEKEKNSFTFNINANVNLFIRQ